MGESRSLYRLVATARASDKNKVWRAIGTRRVLPCSVTRPKAWTLTCFAARADQAAFVRLASRRLSTSATI